MRPLDDDDDLPATPTEAETALATQLGSDALKAMDAALLAQAGKRWLKVARIVGDALKAGEFDPWEEAHLHSHLRRLMALVEAGALEAQGNLRRPRWSEVRLPDLSLDALEQRLEAEPESEALRVEIDAISDRDQRVHWGHTALGVVAALRGDMPAACEHLARSGDVGGEHRLRSYGPSFLLARELCAHGEWQAVDDYLQACKAFWETDLLEELRQEVQRREIPDFPEQ